MDRTAALCIKGILESYVEFIDIVLTNKDDFNKVVAKYRKEDWQKELDKITRDLETKSKQSTSNPL